MQLYIITTLITCDLCEFLGICYVLHALTCTHSTVQNTKQSKITKWSTNVVTVHATQVISQLFFLLSTDQGNTKLDIDPALTFVKLMTMLGV